MRYDHDECRAVLFRSLMRGISTHASLIRDLEKKHRTAFRSGIRAVSYDVLPWQPFIAVSFCTASDDWPRVQWQPADDAWTGFNLIGLHNAHDALGPALDHVHAAHRSAPDSRDLYHLIFLAAADALLDPKVAGLLRRCGIPAKTAGARVPAGEFEYVVVDEDRVFSGNYCEYIRAYRVAHRILGRAPA